MITYRQELSQEHLYSVKNQLLTAFFSLAKSMQIFVIEMVKGEAFDVLDYMNYSGVLPFHKDLIYKIIKQYCCNFETSYIENYKEKSNPEESPNLSGVANSNKPLKIYTNENQ